MMDAWGWGTVFAALALAALLALLGLAVWWWFRGKPTVDPRIECRREPASYVPAGDADSDGSVPAPALLMVDVPEVRPLLHRLYALAFDKGAIASLPLASELSGHEAIATATANLLSRAEFQARHLPRRPQLLPKLMQAINNPNASLDQIARIIGEDPALSANLLRIANSPFYRVRKRPVEGLQRAAALLGMDGLRPVIAAALVQPVMAAGNSVFSRLPALLWEHTQQAAGIASELTRERGQQDEAFTAQMLGLLHGLGSVVVVQVLRDNYALYPHLRPYPKLVAEVLDTQATPMARRIAVAWEQSERVGEALDALQRDAMPEDGLARALRTGHVASALAMLCRHGKLERSHGLATLQAWADVHGIDADFERLWARLQA